MASPRGRALSRRKASPRKGAPLRNVKKEVCVVYETQVKKSDIVETKCSIAKYFYKCLWQAGVTLQARDRVKVQVWHYKHSEKGATYDNSKISDNDGEKRRCSSSRLPCGM